MTLKEQLQSELKPMLPGDEADYVVLIEDHLYDVAALTDKGAKLLLLDDKMKANIKWRDIRENPNSLEMWAPKSMLALDASGVLYVMEWWFNKYFK